jgi:hypothetical protein
MASGTPEKAALNKVYRAVSDGICLKCGGSNMNYVELSRSFTCYDCGFFVKAKEMEAMREAVSESGQKILEFFFAWREERRIAGD